MSIITKLRYVPKHFAVVAAVIVAGTATALTLAWGPERATFAWPAAANYVTFNSMTGTPDYGNETEFTTIKDITAGDANYTYQKQLVPGHEYEVQVYIHNNAHESLNASGVGVAKDTTLKVGLPATVEGSETVDATITASNAKPTSVWDSAGLTSNGKVYLQYQSNSATLTTWKGSDPKNGRLFQKLGDNLITDGVTVGNDALDGNWKGCLGSAGFVTFRFKAHAADFTMDKQVRKHSTTAGGWGETYTAQPGEKVDFIVRYNNTGNVTQENVVVKDALPAGLTYVAGSTILANGSHPSGTPAADGVTTTGLNIGTYAPNATAWVRFSAKTAESKDLACGLNTMKNIATVVTAGGSKTDDATVTVTKDCAPVEKTIEVCRLSDKKYPVTIKENEFDSSKYSKNPADCQAKPVEKTIEVCRLSDKKYPVTIKESEFDSSKYSKTATDCDTPKGAAPIETPAEIPSTGPTELFGSIIGSSALSYGAYSYLSSRRALKKARN